MAVQLACKRGPHLAKQWPLRRMTPAASRWICSTSERRNAVPIDSVPLLPNPVLDSGSTILVTGANGFIASHVVDQLLAAGYPVRGTVRNLARSTWLQDLMDRKYGKGQFQLAKVEDMTRQGEFREAMRGVSGVIHVASIVNFDPDPHKVIPTVVASNQNAIRAAAAEPSVERFVFTSSSHAVIERKPNVEFEVRPDSWNENVIKAAWRQTPGDPRQPYYVYGASKAEGERALWEWYNRNQPNFPLNVVVPNLTMGKVLSVENQVNTMALQMLRWVWEGNIEKFHKFIPPQHYVDVHDCARIHIAALLHPSVSNERLFAFAKPFNSNDILAAFRSAFPGRAFPEDIPDAPKDLSRVPKEKAERLLREMGQNGWTSLEESIRSSGKCFEEAAASKVRFLEYA